MPEGGEGVARQVAPFVFARGFDVVLPVVARHGGVAHDDAAVGCGGEPALPVAGECCRVGFEVVNAAEVAVFAPAVAVAVKVLAAEGVNEAGFVVAHKGAGAAQGGACGVTRCGFL